MSQFSKVLQLLRMHTAPQRALDCGTGLSGLNQVMGPTIPLPMSALQASLCLPQMA